MRAGFEVWARTALRADVLKTWSNYVGTTGPRASFCGAASTAVLANKQAAVTAVGVPLMLLPMLMMIVRQVREWRSLHRR
jgi:hypothetical protein